MQIRTLRLLALLLIGCFPSLHASEYTGPSGLGPRTEWAGHGTIVFKTPKTWFLVGKPVENIAYTFQAKPVSAAKATMQITLVELPPDKPVNAETIATSLREMTKEFVSGSVERKINPRELKLPKGYGLYTELTDASLVGKAPVQDDYKIMRNALIALDERAMVVATMQYDDANEPEATEMLALLSSIQFERSPATSQPLQSAPRITQIAKVGGIYSITFEPSDLVLKIPVNGLVPEERHTGGATNSPSYFNLHQSSPNLIISGWFEPANRFTDLKTFWKGETAGFSKSGIGSPENIEFLKVDDWNIIAYDIQASGVKQANLRAELVQSNTWIDLHLSSTSGESSEATRKRLIDTVRSLSISSSKKF